MTRVLSSPHSVNGEVPRLLLQDNTQQSPLHDEGSDVESDDFPASLMIPGANVSGRSANSSSQNGNGSGRSSISPRSEAFLMTGDRMLRYNSKISPSYARIKQHELPSHVEILDSSPQISHRTNGFSADSEPKKSASRIPRVAKASAGTKGANLHIDAAQQQMCMVPVSQSENLLGDSAGDIGGLKVDFSQSSLASDTEESQSSCVTVNALCKLTGEGGRGEGQSTNTIGSEIPSLVSPSSDSPPKTAYGWSKSEPCSPAHFAFAKASRDAQLTSNDSVQEEVDDDADQGVIHVTIPTPPKSSEKVTVVRVDPQDERPLPPGAVGELSRRLPRHEESNLSTESGTTPPMDPNPVLAMGQQSSITRIEMVEHEGVPDEPMSPISLREKLKAIGEGIGPPLPQKHADPEAAARLAKRLYKLDGFKKSDVIKHIVKDNEFSALVATEFLAQFNFMGLRLDAALRQFLERFYLSGESSERERVIGYFSRRYHECNPGLLDSEGKVHHLACAILLLNSDLHGPMVGKRMSCHDFIENISQSCEFQYPRDLLRSLYQAIKNQPIEPSRGDRRDSDEDQVGTVQTPHADGRFVDFPDPDSQVEYKKGWVMRKCVIEPDGKRTPKGKRSWRMFYATLKGLILYLHKDDSGFKKGSYVTFSNCVRVHHALAFKAVDYVKRQHVFRLQSANYGEYLFRTSDPEDLQSWVDSVNYVAACFSGPPMPPPVGAKQAFQKPLLPSTPSKLNLPDQLREHEKRMDEISLQLETLREQPPPRSAKSRYKEQYIESDLYLASELQRYKTYVRLLRSKLTELVYNTNHHQSPGSPPKYLSDLEPPDSASCSPPLRRSAGLLDEESSDDQSDATVTFIDTSSSEVNGQSDRRSYKAAIYNSAGRSSSYETAF